MNKHHNPTRQKGHNPVDKVDLSAALPKPPVLPQVGLTADRGLYLKLPQMNSWQDLRVVLAANRERILALSPDHSPSAREAALRIKLERDLMAGVGYPDERRAFERGIDPSNPGAFASFIRDLVQKSWNTPPILIPAAEIARRHRAVEEQILNLHEPLGRIAVLSLNLQTATLDDLAPTLDSLAKVWRSFRPNYPNNPADSHVDVRFTVLQRHLQELHGSLERIAVVAAELHDVAIRSPTFTTKKLPDQPPLLVNCSLRQDEVLELLKHTLVKGIAEQVMHMASSAKATCTPAEEPRLRRAYEEISSLLVDVEDSIDEATSTARWIQATFHYLDEEQHRARPLTTERIDTPDATTLGRISQIAESYRDADISRFSRGLVVAESPPEKFRQALENGAKLIGVLNAQSLDAFALYFPPDRLPKPVRDELGKDSEDTAYLALTACSDDLRGSPAHDMLMYRAIAELARSGTKQLALHIHRDNYPSAVAHMRLGARPAKTRDAAAFKLLIMPIDAHAQLLTVLESPAQKIADFICDLPPLKDGQALRGLYLENSARLHKLENTAAAPQRLELTFRRHVDYALKALLTESPDDQSEAIADQLALLPSAIVTNVRASILASWRTGGVKGH